MSALIGLDIGSGTIKAISLDLSSGLVTATSRRPMPVVHPHEGIHNHAEWSEHPAEALWEAICACLREVSQHGGRPLALGIASMAEAGFPVGPDGTPLDNAIAWFDRRSEPQTREVETRIPAPDLYRISGQRVSPSFGLTKLMWLRDHRPAVTAKMCHWLPIPAWILQRLTGTLAVDHTIAARSLLKDESKADWSPDLLDLAGIKASQLPPILWGSQLAGKVTQQAARQTGLPAGLPCAPGSHDHLCAAFCAGTFRCGDTVDSSGTAQAVIQLVPSFSPTPALASSGYAHYAGVLPGTFVIKAGLKAAGSALDWVVRLLSGVNQTPAYAALEQLAQQAPVGLDGPFWLPHFLESGTPQNDRNSRAALLSLTLSDNPGTLYRAFLESLAFWLRHNLETISSLSHLPVANLALIGGLTQVRLLSQIKADVTGFPLHTFVGGDEAAIGAALLAGIAAGVFATAEDATGSLSLQPETLEPVEHRQLVYSRLYHERYLKLYPLTSALQGSG